MPAARPVSRRVLAGAAAAAVVVPALAACSLRDGTPVPRPRRRDVDEPLVRRARADQEQVLALVVATLDAHPSLAATLTPLVEHHRTHVRVLGGEPPSTPATPTTTPTTASPSSTVPGTPEAALTALRATEETASRDRAADAAEAASGDLARVLAAVAASQAQHVVVLAAAGASA